MMEWLKEMLSAKSGQASSKRVCGLLGWLVCLGIAIYAVVRATSVPTFCDLVLFTSAGLLGVDTIANAVTKSNGEK